MSLVSKDEKAVQELCGQVLCTIFCSFRDVHVLGTLELVCQQWYKLIQDSPLYKCRLWRLTSSTKPIFGLIGNDYKQFAELLTKRVRKGRSLVHIAAAKGHVELLHAAVSIATACETPIFDTHDCGGNTPAHLAALKVFTTDENIHEKKYPEHKTYHCSLLQGRSEVMMLIHNEVGTDGLTRLNRKGWTLAHCACEGGQTVLQYHRTNVCWHPFHSECIMRQDAL